MGFKIGQFARELGLPVTTVRYYERIGLLRPSRRTKGGFRLYAEDGVADGRFVRDARRLGLGLADIRVLLALRKATVTPGQRDPRLAALLRRRLEHVERDLSDLRTSRRILARALEIARRPGSNGGPAALDRLVATRP